MDRSKALAVFREITKVLNQSVAMNQVSLDDRSATEDGSGFEIKIKCDFDKHAWICVKPILEKHRLGMKVTDDYVIIYSRHSDTG